MLAELCTRKVTHCQLNYYFQDLYGSKLTILEDLLDVGSGVLGQPLEVGLSRASVLIAASFHY